MTQMKANPRVGRRGALMALAVVALAACARDESRKRETPVDLSAVEEAVMAASSKVRGFGIPTEKVVNGLGHAIVMGPDIDATTPLSADELDAIVRAIWENTPWEPNAIRLAARDTAAGDTAVDLLSPAAELAPMQSGPFASKGATLTLMQDRYGEWKKPA